jgi:cyclic pyranopterin phosphate synthase
MDRVFSAREMLERIEERHALVREDDDDPSSTSMNFRFADDCGGVNGGSGFQPVRPRGRIGLIAPVTRPFCGACSRLRITADGKVRPCLFSHDEWDLRAVLRSGGDDAAVRAFLVNATWTKQAGHGIGSKAFQQPERTMSAIGG